jgi:hypothetical protein
VIARLRFTSTRLTPARLSGRKADCNGGGLPAPKTRGRRRGLRTARAHHLKPSGRKFERCDRRQEERGEPPVVGGSPLSSSRGFRMRCSLRRSCDRRWPAA